jgi:hypothetical protein
MAAHARLSSSQTKQWWNCPGSAAVLEAVPSLKGESSPQAQLGTCAHALIENCLLTDTSPETYTGRIIQLVETETGGEEAKILKANAKTPKDATAIWFEVDDDMVDATTKFTDYVNKRMDELESAELIVEGYTIPLPERDDTGGTADVTIDAWPDVLEVIDYKNGTGVFVPVEGNMQLRSYVLGRAHETGFSHDVYRYTICMPRHHQAPEDGIMTEEITRVELLKWRDELREKARKVDLAREILRNKTKEGKNLQEIIDDLYQRGLISIGEDGSHCTFCELKTRCTAIKSKMQELALIDFEDDPEEIEIGGENRFPIILPWVELIDDWVTKVKAEAKAKLLAGGKVEGYKVVRNASRRSYRPGLSPEEISTICAEEFDIPVEQHFTEPELKRGPALEKLIKGKGSGQRKKEFSERVMIKNEGSLTMAPISDKRSEVVIDIGNDFDDDLE